MKLSVKAFALASGALCALAIFVSGLLAIWKPDWGTRYMEFLGMVYPGVEGVGIGAVVIATLYAAIDGLIGGAVLAWLYNRLLDQSTRTDMPTEPAA